MSNNKEAIVQEAATPAVSAESSSSSAPVVSLDILKTVRTAQLQNGLRHSNYQRYRTYCSSKLQRLRKSLKLTNGGCTKREKQFIPKKITPEMITSDRHLLIPLYQAERCWAYAMELRDETRGDRENFPRKHFHQLRKLASAVKYAGLLQSLCVSTDSKTCLEAEAYHAFFAANSFLAREQWELALENFVRSRTIYDNMLKMGLDPDEMDLFHEKVEEIDPNIRLCQFRINGSAIDASRIIEKSLTSANPTFTLLQSKLEAVIIENRKKQAENIEKIIWRRTAIPLKSEKIKLAVINVQDILTEIDVQQDQEEKLNSYAKLFNSYGDAAEILKAELRESQKIDKKSKKEETAEQNLKLLQLYFQNQKINKTIERNLMLAKSIDSELQSKGLYKKKRLEEIIRIYNNILQNFEDLSAIRDEQDFEDGKQIAAKLLTFKSFRCFYLALSYSTNSPAEASALLNRCITIIDNARSHHHDCASPSSSDLLLLDELEKRAKGELSSLRVMQFLKTQETKGSDSLSDSTAPEVKNEATLSDAPDFFDRRYVADNRIAHFPPEFLPVACKPTLYDLALSNLQFPDLTSRQPKRFWEWWKK